MRRLMTLLAVVAALPCCWTTGDPLRAQDHPTRAAKSQVGLLFSDARACPGYTLLAPMASNETYLIDLKGHVVHTWRSQWQPALGARLLENGNLLRCGAMSPAEQPFGGPGAAARIQEIGWDGELVWDYKFPVDRQLPHHDITRLPNGNVLVVAWDKKTADEAIAAGRREELIDDGQMLSDCVLEIKPTGKTTGEIVWRWHAWDHLIQDHDPAKANYGKIGEHPELIDVNLTEARFGTLPLHPIDRLVGPIRDLKEAPRRRGDFSRDWTHVNSVAYHPQLDQIILSVRAFSEIWIIDHGTTTAEAAAHEGGRYGKGGDLLYRWGNPAAYGAGTKADQRLFKQHDAHWIPPTYPGAGHILLFNNGNNRPGIPHSTADQIVLPLGPDGSYRLQDSLPKEPDQPHWSYSAPVKLEMFSMILSGAQRLPNGNTLICAGASGTLIEVTPEGKQVWKYVNPVHGRFAGGEHRPGRTPKAGRGGLNAVNNALFRAYRYDADFPGLRGKVLQPDNLLAESYPANHVP